MSGLARGKSTNEANRRNLPVLLVINIRRSSKCYGIWRTFVFCSCILKALHWEIEVVIAPPENRRRLRCHFPAKRFTISSSGVTFTVSQVE